MKKDYKKPYLLVESFQLDAAIAASCSSEKKGPLNYGLDTCTLEEELPGLGYFGNLCRHDVKVVGDGYDTICYHGPVDKATAMFMNS